MRLKTLLVLAIAALAAVPLDAVAGTSVLGTAGNFTILSGQSISNTGATTLSGGDVGIHPGLATAITGFGTVSGTFTTHAADAVALQAKNDLITAYNSLAGLAPSTGNDYTTFHGGDLAGLTLTPGVYFFSSTALLTGGTLTLDFQGDPGALFVFQVGSALTAMSGSSVVAINGGSSPGCSVFWQITSTATIGTNSTFMGHIVALTSINLQTGATLFGSALARNGSVTLDNNTITNDVCDVAAVPLPGSAAMGLGLMAIALFAGRHLRRRRPQDAA